MTATIAQVQFGQVQVGQGGEDISMGKGVGATTWVVDAADHERLVPVGCVGELLIEGPLVGRGYLNDERQTASVFIEDPTWLVGGGPTTAAVAGRRGRLYKTGDLVRYNEDGSLVFVGRKDVQVKVRGQRVELGEVEHHVQKHLTTDGGSGLAVAEVITPLGSDNPMLVAFIEVGDVKDKNAAMRQATAHVQEKLAATLPAFMVPSAYIPVERIPVSATGKTDRRRLRQTGSSLTLEQLAELQPSRPTRRSPSTENERRLQRLWARVLDMDPDGIGVDDSFLRIGGDSIGAMRLVGIAREEGVTLTVGDIFQHPQLLDQVCVITQTELDSYHDPIPLSLLAVGGSNIQQQPADLHQQTSEILGVPVEDIFDILPTTSWQEQCLAAPGRCYYFCFDLSDHSDVELLQTCCLELFNCADSLRIVFVRLESGHSLQVVMSSNSQPPPITVYETNEEDFHMFSKRLSDEDRPNIQKMGALMTQFSIVCGCNGRRRLLFRLSHAQYDGVSLGLLVKLFATVYNGGTQQPYLPRFAGYVRHNLLCREGALRHWTSLLDNAELTKLPTTPDNNLPASVRINQHQFKATVSRPRQLHSSTAASMFVAACAHALSSVTGSTDVVFGLIVTGRSTLPGQLQQVVGPCINCVPVWHRLEPSSSLLESCASIQEQRTKSLPFETTNFKDIVQHCTNWPKNTSDYGCVVQYQDIDQHKADVAGIDVCLNVHETEPSSSTACVSIFVKPTEDHWNIEVAASGAHYSHDTVAALLHELVTCCEQMV